MDPFRPRTPHTRRDAARRVREEAAEAAYLRPHPDHLANGEEQTYRRPLPNGEVANNGELSYVANYSKGLPHNKFGEVNQRAYQALVRALHSGQARDFERIPLGAVGGIRLTNPQAGLAFDLEGPDAQAVTMPPAPRIDGAENSFEMGELYWMALLRDVAFVDYGTGANTDAGADNTAAAAASLTADFTVVTAPPSGGPITPASLFRGSTPGDLVGPYLSQFLLLNIPYGTLLIPQRQLTVGPNTDFLTTFPEWLNRQRGGLTVPPGTPEQGPAPGPAALYIRNLRDLATYVHFDALYEAYLNAALILLGMKARLDPGNPYADAQSGQGRTQVGFGTFGGPHILTLVTEVATRALKAVWFQKWRVHRRLRPEAFGGSIQVHRNGIDAAGTGQNRYAGIINAEILNSGVLPRVEARWGSALLPQAFTEGSPTHPAYGAGHATVAGACVTVLKAWFDESLVLPNPMVPNAAGTALVPYAPPAGQPPLTVGGELNKLAGNISLGRNGAGVHWRSDYTESVVLGEEIAIRILQEQKATYNEDSHLSLTRFDGTAITI